MQAIENAGYGAGEDVLIGLDCAASELYRDGRYHLAGEHLQLSPPELVDYLANLADRFPIVSIEDGLDQSDWEGYVKFTKALGDKVQIVGDDFFVTNPTRLKQGIDMKAANAILIKVNQIGTVTETLDAIRMAQKAGYGVISSHRSGETEDSFIADLAVGTGAGQIKTGSLSRTDRVCKYNQLLRIEEQLGSKAVYKGLKSIRGAGF